MSGVLDRMAKRALGALPAVEPLAAAKYASARFALADPALEEMDNGQEASPRQLLKEEARLSRNQVQASPEVGAHLKPARMSSLHQETSPQNTERITRKDTSLERIVDDPKSHRPDLRDMDLPSSAEAQPTRDHEGSIAPVSVVMTEASARRDQGREAAHLPPTRTMDDPKKLAAVAHRGSSSIADQAPALQEQKTEIHISIGSVELRAPRIEAAPLAAPFKPKVNLSEYLRGKPEAGR